MAKLADSAITMTKEQDDRGRQRLVATIAWSSTSAADVAELTVSHLNNVARFMGMCVFGDSGAMASRQPDIYAAGNGLSAVPAGARLVYQATSTVVATQIADFEPGPLGLPVDLSSTASLYVRLQPNTGGDNAATMVLYFLPEA